MGNEPIGRSENIGRAAVVVLEFHDRSRGIITLELENVADARASPAIDRLIRVAGHREIRVVDRESSHDAILHRVCVLVFVDKNPPVPRVEHPTEFGVVHQHAGDMPEQIVEFDRVCLQHHLLIDRPDPLGDLIHRSPPAGLERLGGGQFILGPADYARHTVDRSVGQRQPQFFGGPLEQGACIIGIENRIVARQPGKAGIPPEQAGGKSVKRAHLHRLRADKFRNAAPHFVGRLVGERQRHDLLCRNAGRDQMRNPMRYDAGFAATRAC